MTVKPIDWTYGLTRRFWQGVMTSNICDLTLTHRHGAQIVALMARCFPQGMRILDLSARDATLAEFLLDAGYKVTLWSEMLYDEADVTNRIGQHPLFEGITRRIQPGSYDLVISAEALSWVNAEQQCEHLSRALMALKADGSLVAAVDNDEDLDHGAAICPETGISFHMLQHVSSFKPPSFKHLLQQVGFATDAIHQLELTDEVLRSERMADFRIDASQPYHVGSGAVIVAVARPEPELRERAVQSEGSLLRAPHQEYDGNSPRFRPVTWTSSKVADFWTAVNDTRLRELGFARQSGHLLMRCIESWIPQGARCLDFGAGTGEITRLLLERGLQTAVYEPGVAMASSLQTELSKVPGFLGVIDEQSTETFDVILVCEVIEHILDAELRDVLEWINRMLKPGGILIVSTPNDEDFGKNMAYCPVSDAYFHRWQHLRTFTAATLTDSLSAAGFNVLAVHEAELTDSCFGTTPYIDTRLRGRSSISFGNATTLVYIGSSVGEAFQVRELPHTAFISGAMRPPGRIQSARGLAQPLRMDPTFINFINQARRSRIKDVTLLAPGLTDISDYARAYYMANSNVAKLLVPQTTPAEGFNYRNMRLFDQAREETDFPNPRTTEDVVYFGNSADIGARFTLQLWQAGAKRIWLGGGTLECREIDKWLVLVAPRVLSRRFTMVFGPIGNGLWAGGRSVFGRIARICYRATRAAVRLLPLPVKIFLRRQLDRLQPRLRGGAGGAPSFQLVDFEPLRKARYFAGGPVLQVNNALAWGGVERQVVYVLKGLRNRLQRQVALLCLKLHAGQDYQFYVPTLADTDIQFRDATDLESSMTAIGDLLPQAARDRVAAAISAMPDDVQHEVWRFLAEFLQLRPEVVHCWQDAISVSAGYAAVIAGVPRIVISSRNMNPTNFAYFREYMKAGYQQLARVPSVTMVNNSNAGATDYAQWLGIARDRYVVKRNGIDAQQFCRAPKEAIEEYRSRIGIPLDAPLVGAVFRFYDEKRPMLWVETAARVANAVPDCHFVLFGTGPRRDDMLALAAEAGLGDRLHLPGTEPNAALAISCLDVFLLTSQFEGTPNVLLESQLIGVPVVATRAGGTEEAMSDGKTGWFVPEPNPAELADRVIYSLRDHEWYQQAVVAGPVFVRERFGMERMLDECQLLYGI